MAARPSHWATAHALGIVKPHLIQHGVLRLQADTGLSASDTGRAARSTGPAFSYTLRVAPGSPKTGPQGVACL
jgi:hypothetical protein